MKKTTNDEKGIVLFVENDLDFLNVRAEFLKNAGYRVLKAPTLADAERLLRETHLHLAILDIRMVDDDDERDKSGLVLAKDPAFRSIPKIILTGRPSYEYVREVMEPVEAGLPPAVDFLAKEEGAAAMIEAVEDAFAKHVRLNRALVIRWRDERGPLSFAHLVCLVESNVDSTHLPTWISEMQDLFRKLFYDYNQATFSRLLWCRGRRAALEVFAYSREKESQFVVTYGHIEDIRSERELYGRFVSPAFSAGSTLVRLDAETQHFAATAAAIERTNIEEMQSFAAFYRENHRSGQIRSALNHLFQTTLAPWHQQSCVLEEDKSLAQLYRKRLDLTEDDLPLAECKRRLQALSKQALVRNMADIKFSTDQLMIRFPNDQTASYPDPLPYLYNDNKFPVFQTMCGATPGGLDADTILVDRAARTWLTNFAQAGPAPVGCDFVAFEAAIRFNLIPITAGNLITLHDFDRHLLETRRLSATIPQGDVEPQYRKALIAIQTIRRLASGVVGDPGPYYVGLLFYTLRGLTIYDPALKQTDLEIAGLLYRLLLGAMICRKIDQLRKSASLETTPPPVSRRLRVDEVKREVWVGDKQASLARREFELLSYLYRHAGELCRHSDIMREAFGIEDARPDDETSMINTNIGRLRRKIERDPKNPEYVINIHGEGYKLVVEPE